MTTDDHLDLILAHCRERLAIAEKRTKGEWHVYEDFEVWGHKGHICHTTQHFTDQGCDDNDNFIAACAGSAEAGWRATIAAIVGIKRARLTLSTITRLPQGLEGNAGANEKAEDGFDDLSETISEILAAFPIELLKP